MKNNLISLKEDPIKLFAKWFKEAKNKEINDAKKLRGVFVGLHKTASKL